MPPIPPTALSDITNRLNSGESSRQIARAVGVSKSYINNMRNTIAPDTPRPKAGAPPKLTDREKRLAARLITFGQIEYATEATKVINRDRVDHVSPYTVRRALKQADMVARRPIKKPMLGARHRKARLKWALEHRNWTSDDWMRVIWSDETKINRIGSDGKVHVWCRKGEGLTDRRCQPTVKFGGGNIMVWGCLTWAGVGILAKIEGRMNSEQYCSILTSSLVPTMAACTLLPGFPPQDQLIFQQDNDPKHTSRLAKSWFEEAGIQPMPWPAQSPDLNPIEHLWYQLKRKITAYQEPAKGVHELWSRAQAEWAKITVEACRRLIESMPDQVEAVIKAKAGPTKY